MKGFIASKFLILTSILVSPFLIVGCNDSNKNEVHVQQPVKPIPSIVIKTTSYQATATKELAGYSQLVHYIMPGINNKNVTATTLVMTPKGPSPVGGWRIVVWAHGTSGVGDTCAPSASVNPGGAGELLAALLNQGYMVVAPDYEGLGTEGIHPYLNLKSEAQSILYSIKAAKELVRDSSNDWMVFGHSQGGHAALGAAQYSSELGYNFRGTVAGAPPSHFARILPYSRAVALKMIAPDSPVDPQAANLANLITQSLATTSTPSELSGKLLRFAGEIVAEQNSYIAYIGAGIRAKTPTFDYSVVFHPPFLSTAVKSETECLGSMMEGFGTTLMSYILGGNNLKDINDIKPEFLSNPTVTTFLDKEEPGATHISGPVLIVQGALDTAVPAILTDKLVDKMKSQGTNVTYKVYPSANHVGGLITGMTNGDIMTFLQTNMPSK